MVSQCGKRFAKTQIYPVVVEEELWPFQVNSLDIVISSLNMNWVNDFTTALQRMLDSIRPNGMLFGCQFGDETLQELSVAYQLCENERHSGVSPHISPTLSISELGNTLDACQLQMATMYSEKVMLLFDSCVELLEYLQQTGEGNALLDARPGTFKDVLYGMIAIYNSMCKDATEEDKVKATFEILYFSGWKYHESQKRNRRRSRIEFDELVKELTEQNKDMMSKIRMGAIEGDDIIEKK